MNRVLFESIVVGIFTGITGFIISTSMMTVSKNFSWKKYHFWPQVFLSFFLTGFVLHLLFEYFKMNQWYCQKAYPCVYK